ncbi:MAG: sensor histidine kinase N-terminal domain-containing protein [Betaproteobacteria bacterium]|nr:sensor histidine kinase N-terminal domain-containing protein [Betaproteobacteria bacterium]
MRFNSLRTELFFWVLVPLAFTAMISVGYSLYEARLTAALVQERMLLGSARMIAEQVHYQDDAIVVQIPPAALELFQEEGSVDHVYYRVTSPDGQLLSGYYEMPVLDKKLLPEEHAFQMAIMRGEPIRIAGFAQPLFGSKDDRPVIIEVGQTNHSRDALVRQLWLRDIIGQFALLVLVAILIWLGLRHGLSPIMSLRAQMLRRKPGVLEPLESSGVPGELKPLVVAVNDYVQRLNHHMSAHSRFIADAAHQLRTPLSVLNTQITYALRTGDAGLKDEALHGLREAIQGTTRLVSQLLTFSEAEAGIGPHAEQCAVDLNQAAKSVVESVALLADQKQIDLGFESSLGNASVRANEHMLYKMLVNLVENAINYTPAGGIVTVAVCAGPLGTVVLAVEDNGPGIPSAEHQRVFERFVRLPGSEQEGCGLGLAIVREVANASGAAVELLDGAAGRGLRVQVTFPAADAERETGMAQDQA